ncbi:MAG: response regulator [Chloroflexota bacterium]
MQIHQPTYRILLADDHEVVRSGIGNALRDLAYVEIVSEVGNGIALKHQLAIHQPDGLLIDVAMPDFNPIADIKEIRASYPDMRILVVSAHDDDIYVQGLLGAGVNGYHMKDQPLSDLKLALERVLNGHRWVTGRLLDKLVPSNNPSQPTLDLTRRQKEILQELTKGHDNQTIARNSSLSVKTVENHLTRIYRLLGVQSRLEAVNFLNNNPGILGDGSTSGTVGQRHGKTLQPTSSDRTVLVVDDNPRYRKMLRQTLESLGPTGRVFDASNIAEAVQLANLHRPHLALIDVVLGNESGIDCVRELSNLPHVPRLVLISAYPDQEFRKTGRQAGATALIDKKDLNKEVLRQIVADV